MNQAKTPEISVVIPVYNVERYLRQSIDSILEQSFNDFEIILVDDESPDSSGQICDEYAARDNRISVIHKKNGGLGYARNSGMDAARGRYVVFLDSDDYLHPDTLSILHQTAKKYNAQVVHSRLNRFVTTGIFSHEIIGGKPNIVSGKDALRKSALLYFTTEDVDVDWECSIDGSSCGAIFDLDFLRRNELHFPSERDYISEDYLFNYRCSLHADTIVQLPDTLYHYRVNPNSLSRTPRLNALQRIANYSQYLEEIFKADGFGSEAIPYAVSYALSGIRAQYKFIFLSPLSYREKMAWAKEARQLPYLDEMDSVVSTMPLSRLHRISYNLFRKRRFRSMYILIRFQNLMHRMRGKVD